MTIFHVLKYPFEIVDEVLSRVPEGVYRIYLGKVVLHNPRNSSRKYLADMLREALEEYDGEDL